MSKLEKYSQALSAMEPDEQIARAGKIKSPHALRRVLSEDSPLELVARFANRVSEITQSNSSTNQTPIRPLSIHEQGRIEAARDNQTEALAKYNQDFNLNGFNPKNYRAAGLLFYTNPDLAISMIGFLHSTLESGKTKLDDYETNLALGLAYEKIRREMETIDTSITLPYNPIPPLEENMYIIRALKISPDAELTRRFMEGFVGLLTESEKEIAKMESIAQTGDQKALGLLQFYYEKKNDPDNLIRIMELRAKYGNTHLYKKIGETYERIGNFNAAIQAYERAIKAGCTESLSLIANIWRQKNSPSAQNPTERMTKIHVVESIRRERERSKQRRNPSHRRSPDNDLN